LIRHSSRPVPCLTGNQPAPYRQRGVEQYVGRVIGRHWISPVRHHRAIAVCVGFPAHRPPVTSRDGSRKLRPVLMRACASCALALVRMPLMHGHRIVTPYTTS
jgi:hypothetical protein